MPTTARRFLRCPCCGQLAEVGAKKSAEARFQAAHRAEALVQHLGGYAALRWETDVLTADERDLLAAALRRALAALEKIS